MLLMAILAIVQAVRESTPRALIGSGRRPSRPSSRRSSCSSRSSPGFGNWNLPIFLGLFVALMLAIGVPIAFCFGLGTLAFLTFASTAPIFVMIGRMDEGMSSIILLSVPIFVLLGCILDATGMGKAIVEFLASLLGHVQRRHVLRAARLAVPRLRHLRLQGLRHGDGGAGALPRDEAARPPAASEMIALLATGAAMADTVPPSIVLIVLGSVAGRLDRRPLHRGLRHRHGAARWRSRSSRAGRRGTRT